MHPRTIELREKIRAALPEGSVVTAHTEKEHFYKVVATGDVYPSVTGKLQVLKEEGISDWKMNRALDYVFTHHSKFTDETVMMHLQAAAQVPVDQFEAAGDIGTRIHGYRELYFEEWMKTGIKPASAVSFIPEVERDVRAISAMRALEKFCAETEYEPVITEQRVYNKKLKLAGALDDLGTMRKVVEKGRDLCLHIDCMAIPDNKKYDWACIGCGRKTKREFVLMDLKTSNQFKNHYFFQVALYFDMFRLLTGLTPERCFILKVSKEDGTYKIEDLKRPKRLAQYARQVLKVNEALDFIKSLRKDNQKTVVKINI
jgi:hypothetical protein